MLRYPFLACIDSITYGKECIGSIINRAIAAPHHESLELLRVNQFVTRFK